jgi:hypothetical protein
LLDTEVIVDGSVSGSACQMLVFSVHNVYVRLRVPVSFCQTKVDDVHNVGTTAQSHEKVVGFNITMNERLGMDVLNSQQGLISNHQGGFLQRDT